MIPIRFFNDFIICKTRIGNIKINGFKFFYGKIKKFVVTENGASFADVPEKKKIHDVERIEFLKAHMAQLLRAKKDGINVKGYFVWTLMDNFEWAEGYTQRFGLVYTNFKNNKRYIKDSGYWLANFLKE